MKLNNITIEKIDEIVSRIPNVKYEVAKDALIKCNGDVLDAIIYIESNHKTINKNDKINKMKTTLEDALPKDKEDLKMLKDDALNLIKRSNVIKIIVEDNKGKVVLNLPLTIGVVGVALGPLFALVGVGAAVVSKYQIKIQNEEDGTVVNLGKLSVQKINMIKDMVINSSKKDNKDITDELFNEDDFKKY